MGKDKNEIQTFLLSRFSLFTSHSLLFRDGYDAKIERS